ncbi:MAG: THxN family PEP-CTERM protein [Aulosira sp. ZfuVER01]|nr:THxN family PEP-CTERM protein [Aulosira sp. ZfuVER01]MDZ8002955.1 THxN family PEP-CTERM protein [Aulosira sp. DedVER01a]MDZ8053530.1 THxN family PEP-CTERM protein [Aulosira sp. ZfuCHP01]
MATLNLLTKFSIAMTATTALGFFASSASALTLTDTSANWSNTVGGSNVIYQTVGTEKQVRWGQDIGNGQSGLGFLGATSVTFNPDQVFQIGTLKHYNNAIAGGSAASQVDFDLALNFSNPSVSTQPFKFSFGIDETPNSGNVNDCPYYSTAVCSDKISFSTLPNLNTFNVAGVDYTLQLLGFSETPNGTPTNYFISQEGGTSLANLYAKITVATPSTQSVPEPSSGLSIFAFGVLAAGSMLNRKQRLKAIAKV